MFEILAGAFTMLLGIILGFSLAIAIANSRSEK